MQEPEDRLLSRWCASGDARALGELFDLASPRLFKLAVHLVGDAATAEDLVQGTFLTVIERRKVLDASRPAMPWLLGVLAHKAGQARRAGARTIDVERLHERTVEAPDAALERREISGELAQAIDRLREPYRQVLLLRARHGLGLADIAHVLERDPGTVRVQLHRGVEELRRMLPAALTSVLLTGLVAPRGLAAVKAGVMSEAGAAAAAAGTTGLVAGALMSKKIVAVACALALATWFALRERGGAPAEPASGAAQVAAGGLGPRSDTSIAPPPRDAPPADSSARRSVVDAEPLARGSWTGVVRDVERGVPLAGVEIALYAGRETASYELQRDAAVFYEMQNTGKLRARTHADWPRLWGANEATMAGREKLLALDVARPDDEPLARAISDAAGRFTIADTRTPVLLSATLPGYGTRWRPIVDASKSIEVGLWKLREVRGRVVRRDGKPIREALELTLASASELDMAVHERWTQQVRAGEPLVLDGSEREGIACVRVATDAKGVFRIAMGAPNVHASVLSTGWRLAGPQPEMSTSREIVVTVAPAPVIHVFDAATRAPIERVRHVGREQANGYVRCSGEICAPGGMLTLPLDLDVFALNREETLVLTIWSDEHEPATQHWRIRELTDVIEFPLRAGSPAAIEGLVLRSGKPVDGAEVSLLGHSPLQWSEDDEYALVLDGVIAREGRFRLQASKGTHVLSVRHGIDAHDRTVTLPSTAPLRVDLDHLARIDVEIVDELGNPRPDHVVALRGSDGRSRLTHSDTRGRCSFGALPAGRFTLMTVHVNTPNSFAPDVLEALELTEGETRFVRVATRASMAPRHARVVARDTASYSDWRARFEGDAWAELAADGTIPLDLGAGRGTLEIEATRGRRWRVEVPADAPDGHVIALDTGSASYLGEFLDAAGAPIAHATLHVQPWEDCAPPHAAVETTTDSAGRFRIDGLEPCVHVLHWEVRGLPRHVVFTPKRAASDAGTRLSIVSAVIADEVTWRGSVRDSRGAAQDGLLVVVQCTYPQADGTLRVALRESFAHTSAEGAFELRLPRAPTTRFSVHPTTGGDALATADFADDGSNERAVEVTVPRER